MLLILNDRDYWTGPKPNQVRIMCPMCKYLLKPGNSRKEAARIFYSHTCTKKINPVWARFKHKMN